MDDVKANKGHIMRYVPVSPISCPHLTCFSIQSENCVAAIAVLYRSILKDSSSMSTRADLEYLRAGKLHLDWLLPSSVLGPLSKALFNDMVSSAEDLLWRQNTQDGGRRPESKAL